jgi:hypothetical protein
MAKKPSKTTAAEAPPDPNRPRMHTYLSDEVTRQFVEQIKKGLPLDLVCGLLRIPTSTFWHWKKRGEAYLTGNYEPAEDAIFAEFLLQVNEALAELHLIYYDMAVTDPEMQTTGRWFLERRYRNTYGREVPTLTDASQYDPDDRFL